MNTNTNTSVVSLLASYTPGQIEFIKFLQANRKDLTVYDDCTVSRMDLITLCTEKGKYIAVPAWIGAAKSRRANRGHYYIPELGVDVSTLTVNNNTRGRKPGSKNQKGVAFVPPSSINMQKTMATA